MSLLRDERGSVSTARVGLWTVLLFLGWYIVSHEKPDTGVLSLGGTALVMFGGWAAGSKFATAWGGLGQVAQGIASARPPWPTMDINEKGDDD
jgi:hypothetical protein